MKRSLAIAAALIALVALVTGVAYAQSYSFQLEQEVVDVFLESDGTYRLAYAFLFANEPGGSPIDFVDVGLPSSDYDLSSIRASVDGQPTSDISTSPYVTPGVAVGLGDQAIPSGQTGTLLVEIGRASCRERV